MQEVISIEEAQHGFHGGEVKTGVLTATVAEPVLIVGLTGILVHFRSIPKEIVKFLIILERLKDAAWKGGGSQE
jgi:hypothetical protein